MACCTRQKFTVPTPKELATKHKVPVVGADQTVTHIADLEPETWAMHEASDDLTVLNPIKSLCCTLRSTMPLLNANGEYKGQYMCMNSNAEAYAMMVGKGNCEACPVRAACQ